MQIAVVTIGIHGLVRRKGEKEEKREEIEEIGRETEAKKSSQLIQELGAGPRG